MDVDERAEREDEALPSFRALRAYRRVRVEQIMDGMVGWLLISVMTVVQNRVHFRDVTPVMMVVVLIVQVVLSVAELIRMVSSHPLPRHCRQ
jgi:hypothetical protein